MGIKLRKIEIYNFRSIKSISIKSSELAILVGNNDSGKSNILRALNLFFNGETNPGERLDFRTDHNIFNDPSQRAKEIRIKLEIDIPDAYKAKNGDYIVWEKKWRKSGEIIDGVGYQGIREKVGPRGGKAIEPFEISPKSNLHSLLRNINFLYVPAIKDRSYFNKLRAAIYSVIAEVATEQFRISSTDFEKSIAEHLQGLTSEITNALGFNSKLALPRDLSHIFETLDFLDESKSISLNERGDGVKTRHIPIILKFMADKLHTIQVRGAQPYTFIWGYEEPENNLEFANCVKLSDQVRQYLYDGIDQIFITTHSPVFYNLHKYSERDNAKISRHHIYRETDELGTKETPNPDDIDDYMGTMSLLAPQIEALTQKIKDEQTALTEADQQLRKDCCPLYVEGESDRIILKRAIELFAPEYSERIEIITKLNGAGHSYVVDMLTAWRHVHKHHTDRPKAAGLVDADDGGRSARKSWNSTEDNCHSAKCFQLKTPLHIQGIRAAGFLIPVVLESLYPARIWKREKNKGKLVDMDITDFLHKDKLHQLVKEKTTVFDLLSTEWQLYSCHTFSNERKVAVASSIARQTDESAQVLLSNFRDNVNEIVHYLFAES